MNIDNHKDGENLAERLSKFLQELGENTKAKVTYYKNCVRQGTLFNYGEAGIILNDDAIDVLVDAMKYLIENLTIKQAKGFLFVEEVDFDYNDSEFAKDMMRLKSKGLDVANPDKEERKYAQYFKGE